MDEEKQFKFQQFKDKYVITKDDLFGEGCFGQVYSCKKIDETDTTVYCVKIIPLHTRIRELDKNKKIQSLIQKYITQVNPQGPSTTNLVQIHDIFLDCYALYVVMEKCDDDLSTEFYSMIQECKWYNEEEIFDLFQQIIIGFKQLNLLKIIHQNIKPENILIKFENKWEFNERKVYKIADFGIKTLVEELTKQNDLIITGSPNYSSPQVLGGGKFSEKSDIFSLGVLFYQICYNASLPYDCSSMEKRHKSLLNLKNNGFQAPHLDFKKEKKLRNLIDRMIVYDENERISFEEIFQDFVMKTRSLEDTVCIGESASLRSTRFQDKSINLQIKRRASILVRLEKLSKLLQLFQIRFKICKYFISQINEDISKSFLKLNLYLIANQQLLYAIALIYVQPSEIHPNIGEENDLLLLIHKLREVDQEIKTNQKEYQTYNSLKEKILKDYHQFKDQYNQFLMQMYYKRTFSAEQDQFFEQSQYKRINIAILLKNITNFKNFNDLPNELNEYLDTIIQLDRTLPISIYKTDIDLNSLIPKQIRDYEV